MDSLESVIRPVIADLASFNSSDAYTTFFKHIKYRDYVRDVFTNITQGTSVDPKPGMSEMASFAPIFYCVDGRDQFTWIPENKKKDAYTQCRSHTTAPAMAILNTPYIVLCPYFFDQPGVPIRSSASCYTTVPNQRRFVQDGKSLVKYQIWTVIHELVHYYVWSTKLRNADVYPINACLGLFGEVAALNPNSYIYYAASKWLTQLLLLRSPYA